MCDLLKNLCICILKTALFGLMENLICDVLCHMFSLSGEKLLIVRWFIVGFADFLLWQLHEK